MFNCIFSKTIMHVITPVYVDIFTLMYKRPIFYWNQRMLPEYCKVRGESLISQVVASAFYLSVRGFSFVDYISLPEMYPPLLYNFHQVPQSKLKVLKIRPKIQYLWTFAYYFSLPLFFLEVWYSFYSFFS